jgi:predicted small metal-binding protein
MTYRIACKDVTGTCGFVAQADTEDELLKKVADHAREVHGITHIDDATLAQVKGAIKQT